MIPIEQSIVSSVISQASQKYGLDPNLVLAVISHETAGKTFLTRFEPTWKFLLTPEVFAQKLGITVDTEKVLQSTSWGLMQVMGSVARQYGFEEELPKLTDPNLGLDYGCRHLKHKMDVYCGHESDAISAYNAGQARKDETGKYTNQDYVDSVTQILTELRQLKQ